jgi:ketosteroid isomerase-like protein
LKFDSYTTSDVSIRVYGDTGVVTGIESTKGNLDGTDRSGRRRFTRIYVKKQGRWQIVNNQLSNMLASTLEFLQHPFA